MNDLSQIDDELLSAYLDDELAPAERARVEQRIASDPAARQLLEEVRSVSKELKSLPLQALGTDLRESVLHRAEREMLVSGARASSRGLGDVVRSIPIGRSARAWLWAGAAIAAALMLMVFEQSPEKNGDLPGQIAQRSDELKDQREPRAPLAMRALETPADETAKDRAAVAVVADQSVPVPVLEPAAPATSIPGTTGVVASRSAITLRRELLDSKVREKRAPSRLADQAGALGGAVTRSELARDAPVGDGMLVVHVDMKPEALHGGEFDKLLVKNQIEVEALAADKPISQPPQDVDVVLVEAAPFQIASCLSDLKQDDTNYLGIAVDDRQAKSEHPSAGEQPPGELTQYNRGLVQNRQQVELTPDNSYYYARPQGQAKMDRLSPAKNEGVPQETDGKQLGFATQGRAMRVAPLSQSIEAIGKSTAQKSTSNAAASAANSPVAEGFSDDVKQNVTRRATQKLATKADTWQVLFVLTCPTIPPAAAAPTAVVPATEAPASVAPAAGTPAEEGLKRDE